jgi:putative component of toxin-antitoxin plasmid stabilization module
MIRTVVYQRSDGVKPFPDWLDSLADKQAKARITVRVNHGPGYRVFISRQGPVVVLLLCGSDKGNQDRAIERAIDYLNDWKQRGQP